MIANEYGRITPRKNYRDFTVPTARAFHWADGITQTGPGGLYGVEFTSVQNLPLKKVSPGKFILLHALDNAARDDAAEQDGYNWYFADEVSPEGLARSFCLWDSQEEAEAASRRPAHQDAVGYTFSDEGRDVYDFYGVHKFSLEATPSGLVLATIARVAVSHGVMVINEQMPAVESLALGSYEP